jgi:hypothetical protein
MEKYYLHLNSLILLFLTVTYLVLSSLKKRGEKEVAKGMGMKKKLRSRNTDMNRSKEQELTLEVTTRHVDEKQKSDEGAEADWKVRWSQ